MSEILLTPAPRQITLTGGALPLAVTRLILLDSPDPQALRFSAKRFQRALYDRFGLQWEVVASHLTPPALLGLTLQVDAEQVAQPQGYRLSITPEGIVLAGRDPAGIFYGICTLIQIVEQAGEQLPCLTILDWPDFPVRGVMLDVSRDKVPTMETLFELVDMLAGWKINQFQLYMEHTFAYRQHPDVWMNASPFTGQEVIDLDQYCRERFIDLVPNQNSFGHMHRWLDHPRYAHLSEVQGGVQMPWGFQEGTFSLCPIDPACLELVGGLYDELLPHFSSRLFNVGCDETFDIGQGRSREAVSLRGAGRVYLDFLLQIYQEVKARGRTMQFWGDIIQHHPEFIPELPRDVIALEWGYEKDHPYAQTCARYAEAGLPFYVCPGTSSWASLSGRTDNALANLKSAAENGLKYGAAGYLITDWGDSGHWQPLPVSYLGFLAGAAYAWAFDVNREMDIVRAISLHAFRDPTGVLGRVAYDLGNVYQAYGLDWVNSSILFATLQRTPEKIRLIKHVNSDGYRLSLEAIERAMQPLGQSASNRPDAALILEEFELVARMLRHACWRGIFTLEGQGAQGGRTASDLNDDIAQIMADFRSVWLARNRPGGLADSLKRFETSRQAYQQDQALTA